MSDKLQKQNRAIEIIKSSPNIGRRTIAKILKKEFGSAIRDSEILTLKQLHSPKSYPTELSKIRIERLKSEGFLPEEASYYINVLRVPISQSGMRQIRRFRKAEVRRALRNGIKNIPKYIKDSYYANNWVDEKGDIKPDVWNSKSFYQLERKPKDRESVLLKPETYSQFKKVSRIQRFSVKDALDISKIVPPELLNERLQQYKILTSAFYTKSEALRIILATYKDNTNKLKLQNLDLNNPAWQLEMQERINWIKSKVQEGRRKGLTYHQALARAKREIEAQFLKDPNLPFSGIRELYNIKTKPKVKNFKSGLREREKRLEKKRMPWKVSRR